MSAYVFQGQADRQSLDQLNRLLDEGWRIAAINPSLQRLPGTGNFKAFTIDLMKRPRDAE